MSDDKELLEKLADLEHLQWCNWSQDIAHKERISKERLERWRSLWIPYEELPEKAKEEDRKYARAVLEILDEKDGEWVTRKLTDRVTVTAYEKKAGAD